MPVELDHQLELLGAWLDEAAAPVSVAEAMGRAEAGPPVDGGAARRLLTLVAVAAAVLVGVIAVAWRQPSRLTVTQGAGTASSVPADPDVSLASPPSATVVAATPTVALDPDAVVGGRISTALRQRMEQVELPEGLLWGTSYDFAGNGYVTLAHRELGDIGSGVIMEVHKGWQTESEAVWLNDVPRDTPVVESRWSIAVVTSDGVLFKVSIDGSALDPELAAIITPTLLEQWLRTAVGDDLPAPLLPSTTIGAASETPVMTATEWVKVAVRPDQGDGDDIVPLVAPSALPVGVRFLNGGLVRSPGADGTETVRATLIYGPDLDSALLRVLVTAPDGPTVNDPLTVTDLEFEVLGHPARLRRDLDKGFSWVEIQLPDDVMVRVDAEQFDVAPDVLTRVAESLVPADSSLAPDVTQDGRSCHVDIGCG